MYKLFFNKTHFNVCYAPAGKTTSNPKEIPSYAKATKSSTNKVTVLSSSSPSSSPSSSRSSSRSSSPTSSDQAPFPEPAVNSLTEEIEKITIVLRHTSPRIEALNKFLKQPVITRPTPNLKIPSATAHISEPAISK